MLFVFILFVFVVVLYQTSRQIPLANVYGPSTMHAGKKREKEEEDEGEEEITTYRLENKPSKMCHQISVPQFTQLLLCNSVEMLFRSLRSL